MVKDKPIRRTQRGKRVDVTEEELDGLRRRVDVTQEEWDGLLRTVDKISSKQNTFPALLDAHDERLREETRRETCSAIGRENAAKSTKKRASKPWHIAATDLVATALKDNPALIKADLVRVIRDEVKPPVTDRAIEKFVKKLEEDKTISLPRK
jgi:hypothetical protein